MAVEPFGMTTASPVVPRWGDFRGAHSLESPRRIGARPGLATFHRSISSLSSQPTEAIREDHRF
jgi:hypothetical protein